MFTEAKGLNRRGLAEDYLHTTLSKVGVQPLARTQKQCEEEPKLVTGKAVSEASVVIGKEKVIQRVRPGLPMQGGRRRNAAEQSPEEHATFQEKKFSNFNSLLRLVSKCYVKTPVDYYSSDLELWRAPEAGEF